MVMVVVYFYLLASPFIVRCVGGGGSIRGSNSVMSGTASLSTGIGSGSNSLSSNNPGGGSGGSNGGSSNSGSNSNISGSDLAGSSGGSSSSITSSNSNSNSRNTGDNARSRIGNDQQLPPTLSSRIVHTRNGAISGVIVQLEGRHLDPVESYRGIPYASPPIGNLRFMPPVSAAMWSGVKKADRLNTVLP